MKILARFMVAVVLVGSTSIITSVDAQRSVKTARTNSTTKVDLPTQVNSFATKYEVIIMVVISIGGSLVGLYFYFYQKDLESRTELARLHAKEDLECRIDEALVDRVFNRFVLLEKQLQQLDDRLLELHDSYKASDKNFHDLSTMLNAAMLDLKVVRSARRDLLTILDNQMAALDAQLSCILSNAYGPSNLNVALYRPTFRAKLVEHDIEVDDLLAED